MKNSPPPDAPARLVFDVLKAAAAFWGVHSSLMVGSARHQPAHDAKVAATALLKSLFERRQWNLSDLSQMLQIGRGTVNSRAVLAGNLDETLPEFSRRFRALCAAFAAT